MGIYQIIIEEDKILREVESISAAQKIIDILQEKNYFNSKVVETKIAQNQINFLEHKKLSPIIHSGEFTVSMALDITKIAFEQMLDLVDCKLYSYDLMPNNYTYQNGNWILYDFGAFELLPKNVQTQSRSTFKITFSSLELLKKIDRAELKHYFLNRISHPDLFKMISPVNWLVWSLNLAICLILCKLRLYRESYLYLNHIFKKYENNFQREYYRYTPTASDKALYTQIDKIVESNNISSIFALGEKTAQWTINSQNKIPKFVYLDDYEICDKFYNFIFKNKYVEISTSVVYPLMEDNKINKNYTYRGIYDYFSQYRYNSDAVVILDVNEIYGDKEFNSKDFCNNISEFANKMLIMRIRKSEKKYFDEITTELKEYFKSITIEEIVIFLFSIKIFNNFNFDSF